MAGMQTLSPSMDRIGAALRALRHAHAPGDEDETALGLKCLHAVVGQLAEAGLAAEDLKPLADLDAYLREHGGQAAVAKQPERRKGRALSEMFLARVAALVDLLVKAGAEEGEAAQIVMRWLLAAGVPAPAQGADARGWKRLLAWRQRLSHGFVSDEAKDEYREFTRQLDAIPANERVRRVLDERLWDRTHKQKGASAQRSTRTADGQA
jgi:hypothetical protein